MPNVVFCDNWNRFTTHKMSIHISEKREKGKKLKFSFLDIEYRKVGWNMKIMNRETLFIIKAGYNAETEWRNDLANFGLLILRHPLHRTLTQNSS